MPPTQFVGSLTTMNGFTLHLRMFGTDFGMISTYLGGGKSSRHVKNKFDREEKVNPDKVDLGVEE